jgi:hypothetical protein
MSKGSFDWLSGPAATNNDWLIAVTQRLTCQKVLNSSNQRLSVPGGHQVGFGLEGKRHETSIGQCESRTTAVQVLV